MFTTVNALHKYITPGSNIGGLNSSVTVKFAIFIHIHEDGNLKKKSKKSYRNKTILILASIIVV